MNKLIETLAALNLSSADTKIIRLDESSYKLESNYGYNDVEFDRDGNGKIEYVSASAGRIGLQK